MNGNFYKLYYKKDEQTIWLADEGNFTDNIYEAKYFNFPSTEIVISDYKNKTGIVLIRDMEYAISWQVYTYKLRNIDGLWYKSHWPTRDSYDPTMWSKYETEAGTLFGGIRLAIMCNKYKALPILKQ